MITTKQISSSYLSNYFKNSIDNIGFCISNDVLNKQYIEPNNINQLVMKQNQIVANVQGRHIEPYKTKLIISRFNSTHLSIIRSIIFDDPDIASSLNESTLHEQLLQKLENERIFFLPHDRMEVETSCNCRDWENPCEHVRALYAVLIQQIQLNPFLLFEIRGLNKEKILNIANKALTKQTTTSVISAIPLKETIEKPKIILNKYEQRKTYQNSKENFQDKFIKIENVIIKEKSKAPESPNIKDVQTEIDSIFKILPEHPTFYDRTDFKAMLEKLYIEILEKTECYKSDPNIYKARNANFYLYFNKDNKLKAFVTPSTYFSHYLKSLSSRTKFRHGSIEVPVIDETNNSINFKNKEGIIIQPDNFFTYFRRLPYNQKDVHDTASSIFFNYASSLAIELVKKGLFIPEVIFESHSSFSIRYLPHIKNDLIAKQLELLKKLMPENVFFKRDNSSVLPDDAYIDILSLFVTDLIHNLKLYDNKKYRNNLIRAFTTPTAYILNKNEDSNTPNLISNWLQALYIKNHTVSPMLRIELDNDDSFRIYIDLKDKANSLNPIIPYKEIYHAEGMLFSQPVEKIIDSIEKQLAVLSIYMPILDKIISSKGNIIPILKLNQMADVITKTLNVMKLMGINVTLPKELKNFAKAKISYKAKIKKNNSEVSYLSLNELLTFSYELAIGDETITKEEFRDLVKSADGIIKYKNQYLLLEPEEVNKILDNLDKPMPKLNNSLDILHATISRNLNGFGFKPDEALQSVINDMIKVEEIEIPDSLKNVLRPYQERGYKWLYSNAIKKFGSCIADDMGLGKTIQVLSLILKLKEENKLHKPALVVCPTTLIGNWYKECEKFTPSLKVLTYYGSNRNLNIDNIDLIITSYGILRRDIHEFIDKTWDLLIIDEAQNIKNPDTDQTRAVKCIKSNASIAMSGTPVENRLSELWSIFDFINCGYLGSIGKFQKYYATPIEKHRDGAQIESLKLATSPFILRRLKTDKSIISDLPDKIISNEYCYLQKEQAALYENTVKSILNNIDSASGIQRRGLIFKLITSLKQICNHPSHYTKTNDYSKILSGKAETTISLLEKILEKNEKAIIFTQYKEMGNILLKMISKELNEDSLFFHGSVPRLKRDQMVELFQQDNDNRVMVVSLKAGGTGLNLTRATNVIHYDLWWNPAVENQATDRTYRIGQNKNVFIYRLITLGTFEEKIDEIIRSKQELADLTVSAGENWISDFSNDDLREIFTLNLM